MEEVKIRKREVGREGGRQGGKEQDAGGRNYVQASDGKDTKVKGWSNKGWKKDKE